MTAVARTIVTVFFGFTDVVATNKFREKATDAVLWTGVAVFRAFARPVATDRRAAVARTIALVLRGNAASVTASCGAVLRAVFARLRAAWLA